ncbi:SagB/ThcOx family dehydrogenase [Alicyclobacillus sp. SO9]|uniref:SagB/ThcOx family dehydrogenase n=1 Tax=Alicyclobacillus sp. SO9 TaxID=2665646 RepID=UPI0018E768FF|nr:SagB/ThcOx family dehydrogenase [Alicyclobacillus sp. SO9]QQE80166.1 SagB/ThcOx family dehydrogenase [Alicyclobacillus sp. SO9]
MDGFWSLLFTNHLASEIDNEERMDMLFHVNSKLSRRMISPNMVSSRELLSHRDMLKTMQTSEKSYPDREFIPLPDVRPISIPLGMALRERRSRLMDTVGDVTVEQLSQLLWAGNGLTGDDRFYRTAPSGGALYPCELYVISRHSSLKAGIYHYRSLQHGVEYLDSKFDWASLFVPGTEPKGASLLIVTTAVFQRSFFKYGERSYRFILLEAGAIAQNIALAACDMNLGVLPHGGYSDVEVERQLQIDGIDESVVHVVAVGGNKTGRESNEPRNSI